MKTNKITLGLLVFFIGVMITACGSKKSASNTTTNNTAETVTQNPVNPINNNSSCAASGICSSSGTYSVTNPQLYGQALGYTAAATNSGQIQPVYNNNTWNLGGFFSSLIGSTANCAAQVGIARLLVQIGVNSASADCTLAYGTSTSTSTDTSGYPTGSYPVNLQANYSNSQFTSLAVIVRTGRNGGNGDVVEFYPSNDANYLYNNNRSIRLNTSGTQLIMESAQGELGRISN
jgi:hypothetical protein